MELGAFSVSLSVSDLPASRDFYAKLGFQPAGGDGQTFQIMRNGSTVIGLFQGMFEGNILTFNPGWDQQAADLPAFTDVRDLERSLTDAGIEIADSDTAASSEGPAHVVITDPDGNAILIDQHR